MENLPPNWRTAKAADGKEYYFNEMTGETSWTVPTAEEDVEKEAVAVAIGMGEEASRPPSARDVNEISVVSAPHPPDRAAREQPGTSFIPLHPHTPKLLIILIASFVVMLQASIEYPGGGGTPAYAVAVGVVSLSLVVLLFLLAKFKPHLITDKKVPLPRRSELTLMQTCAAFLFVWWGIGCGVLTFGSLWVTTSNAFFGCWTCLFCSMIMCVDTFSHLSSAWKKVTDAAAADMTVQLMFIMMMASVIVILSSLEFIGDSATQSQGAWGLTCGAVTAALSALYFLLQSKKKMKPTVGKIISALIFALWAFGAGVLTFDKPFKVTGNGYFATWTGVVASASLAYKNFFDVEIAWSQHLRRSFAMTSTSSNTRHVVSDLQPNRM